MTSDRFEAGTFLRVRAVGELEPSRVVVSPRGDFTSYRLLLARDGMGFSMTKTLVPAGGPYRWHYRHHLEACFCISGHGEVRESETGRTMPIGPDCLYYMPGHEAHELTAFVPMTLLCVFNPPLVGPEVHRADGSYEGSRP